MKVSRDPTEIRNAVRGDKYNDNWSVITPSGARPIEKNRVAPITKLEPVLGVWWDSSWWGTDERAKDADFVVFFKDDEGIYIFGYTCAGYSSVTYEPETVSDYMRGGTFQDVISMCLDNDQRMYVEKVINNLILSE